MLYDNALQGIANAADKKAGLYRDSPLAYLVLMAGSDLFTGNTLVLPLGVLADRLSWRTVLGVSLLNYLGNFLGSVLVAGLVYQAGTFSTEPGGAFVVTMAAKKMHLGSAKAFCRGILS